MEVLKVDDALKVFQVLSRHVGFEIEIKLMVLEIGGQSQRLWVEMTGTGGDVGGEGSGSEVEQTFDADLTIGVIDTDSPVESLFIVKTVNVDVLIGVAVQVQPGDLAFRQQRHLTAQGQMPVHIEGGGNDAQAVVLKDGTDVETIGIDTPDDLAAAEEFLKKQSV